MIIYKITNLINRKIYIGQDSRNRRNYFGSGKLIYQAIQKYGIKNFKKEILEQCSFKKELNKREIYWIKKLNSKVPNGYNITNGGEGFSGNHSEESKQKMRKPRSEKHRENIGKGSKGKLKTIIHKKNISNGSKGKFKTEIHKENISKGRKNSEKATKQILKVGRNTRFKKGNIPWNKKLLIVGEIE